MTYPTIAAFCDDGTISFDVVKRVVEEVEATGRYER